MAVSTIYLRGASRSEACRIHVHNFDLLTGWIHAKCMNENVFLLWTNECTVHQQLCSRKYWFLLGIFKLLTIGKYNILLQCKVFKRNLLSTEIFSRIFCEIFTAAINRLSCSRYTQTMLTSFVLSSYMWQVTHVRVNLLNANEWPLTVCVCSKATTLLNFYINLKYIMLVDSICDSSWVLGWFHQITQQNFWTSNM